ncbi:MAG: DUF4296 domain-containing protein [Salinivirgaceae bacterium]|nr:DUF4296 domain-containing protein [Salinivirgaceae bacterium]
MFGAKIRRIAVLLTLSVVSVAMSCTHEEGDRPEISRNELVEVLYDIHLADGYLSYSGSRIERDRDKIEGVYGYVLSKHNITPRQFRNTMKYYSRHLEDYEKLYNKVIEKLTRYETENLNTVRSDDQKQLDKPKRNSTH